jgi:outer membrane protein OmpA-like peptidoglycan-associated protein
MPFFTRSFPLLAGVLFLNIPLSYAQSVPFTKEKFPIEKESLKLAQRELALGNHELGADPARFGAALPHFLRAQKFNPNNAILNAKIGECYLHSSTKHEALAYLQNSQKLDATAEPRLHYLLARALHLSGQWEAAIREYELARPVAADATSDDVAVTTDDLARGVRECHRGQLLQAHPVRALVENAGPAVNSAMSDYGSLISADESVLLLTSRRAGSTGGQLETDGEGMLEDIYQCDWNGTAWGPAHNMGTPLNTANNDATAGLSADGQHLLVYLEENGGDIYESDLQGSRWTKPQNLGARLNTKHTESSACYSPDGKYLYFVSDRPEGNRGGRDIYRLELEARKPAENLGPVINSPYDEEGVFMHPDGKTLYFSSKGHDSVGGYDIFKSTLDANGKWSEPENLGWPINTPDDDVYFVLSASGQHGYYSSEQPGGLGGKDIYRVTFLEPEPTLTLARVVAPAKRKAAPMKPLVPTKNQATKASPLVAKAKTNAKPTAPKLVVTKAKPAVPKLVVAKPNAKPTAPKLVVTKVNAKPTAPKLVVAKVNDKPAVPKLEVAKAKPVAPKPLPPVLAAPAPATTAPTVSAAATRVTILKGIVTDAVSKRPLAATIEVVNNKTGQVVAVYQSNTITGRYLVSLPSGLNYGVVVRQPGYLLHSDNFDLPASAPYMEILRDVALKRPLPGATVVLRNIFFQPTQAKLLPESNAELARLQQLLTEQPTLRLELSGQTEAAASTDLGQQRAEAVLSYLANRGIAPSRLSIANPDGAGQPMASSAVVSHPTEFKVLASY